MIRIYFFQADCVFMFIYDKLNYLNPVDVYLSLINDSLAMRIFGLIR